MTLVPRGQKKGPDILLRRRNLITMYCISWRTPKPNRFLFQAYKTCVVFGLQSKSSYTTVVFTSETWRNDVMTNEFYKQMKSKVYSKQIS